MLNNLCSSQSIIPIICLIGFTIQLTDVIYSFLKFEVRFEVTYEYPDEIELPEIDFVLPLSLAINMSSLYLKYPDKTVQLCRRLLKRPNLTIISLKQFDEHWSNIISSFSLSQNLVDSFTLKDIQSSLIDLRSFLLNLTNRDLQLINFNYCKVEHYFTGILYIMRVSCRNQTKPIIEKVNGNLIGNNPILCITHKIFQFYGFRFSRPNSYIETRLSRYRYEHHQVKQFSYVNSQFNRMIIERLPWPYESPCLNYDRSSQLANCLNNQLAVGNYVYTDSVNSYHVHYSPGLRIASYWTVNRNYQLIIDQCLNDFKILECVEIFYLTTKETYSFNESAEKVTICMDQPLNPDLCIRAYPKSSITELLIYISSILGIWYGFSIYGQLKSQDWRVIKNCFTNRVDDINTNSQ